MDITSYQRGKIRISLSAVQDVAGKLWDEGVVERIGEFDASDYSSRMLTATAETMLWTDASHDDDAEGTGKYNSEIQELRLGYSPDYEEALPPGARAELDSDVTCFLRWAWPYLSRDEVTPEHAGHKFQLARNGSDAWDGKGAHNDQLDTIAGGAGAFGLQVTGHGDESDGCDKCGEAIEHIIGPVEDPSDEWVHVDSITDHKPSGPIRVYGHYNG